MSFNNVPVNGWPQIKELEKLDAIAKQIEDMPTFSSSDRAWLDEWETKLPELPEDPETDGVKVLTATTEDGETVKSWEEQQAGENRVYSTTPQDIGVWTNGKKAKRVVINLNSTTTFKNNDWVHIPLSGSDYSIILNAYAIGADGACCPLVVGRDSTNTVVLSCRVDSDFVGNTVIVEYVESEV